LYEKFHSPLMYRGKIFLMYTFFVIPFIIFSFFAGELTVILAAMVMMILSIIYFSGRKEKISLKPWIPYAGLVLLMLLPKIIIPLAELIRVPYTIENIFGTGETVSFRPWQSPLIPFVIVSLFVMYFRREARPDFSAMLKKITAVFIVLYPTIVISQLMLLSEAARPSMVNHIAMIFSLAGTYYISFAPFIGIAGAFITGSTTVSNIIFGPSQLETAQALNVSTGLILSLQHAGASIGNAICLFNIIAAAAVVGLSTYKKILGNNLAPTLLAGLAIGITGMIIYLFL
jgi:lactate permease